MEHNYEPMLFGLLVTMMLFAIVVVVGLWIQFT